MTTVRSAIVAVLLFLAAGTGAIVWQSAQRQAIEASAMLMPLAPGHAVSLVMLPSGPGSRAAALYPNIYHRDRLRRITNLLVTAWYHDKVAQTHSRLASVELPVWPLRPLATIFAAAAAGIFVHGRRATLKA